MHHLGAHGWRWLHGVIGSRRGAPPALADQLNRATSVIEGIVVDARGEFDERAGPTTVYTLSEVETLVGAEVEERVDLTFFGGELPNGHRITDSETPRLFVGARYLLALKGGSWFFSPVIDSLVYRVETNDVGQDVLVDTDGMVAVSVSSRGVDVADEPVIDSPRGDNLYPFEPPEIRDDAWPLLDEALPKHELIDFIRELTSKHQLAPRQSTWRIDRQWNAWRTAAPVDDGRVCEELVMSDANDHQEDDSLTCKDADR